VNPSGNVLVKFDAIWWILVQFDAGDRTVTKGLKTALFCRLARAPMLRCGTQKLSFEQDGVKSVC
jgi:hypothetical protein